MKCPNCGAETKASVCEYCGSEVQQGSKKVTCSKCGSTNIAFKRENQGEVRGKKSKQVIHRTVGYCKDCGNTWYVAEDVPKKRKTWLWVLGWICIFPLPLTILLLRKKNMKPVVKYVIIVAAWLVYLLIGLSGQSTDKDGSLSEETGVPTSQVGESSQLTEIATVDDSLVFELSYDETGEYGEQRVINENTDMPVSYIAFNVPAGTYNVTNKATSGGAQITVYSGTEFDGQWEQFVARCCDSPIVVMEGETKSLTVHEGQFVKLSDGSKKIEFVRTGDFETWEQVFNRTENEVLNYVDSTIAPEYEKRVPTTLDYHINLYGVYTVYLDLILPNPTGEGVRTAMKQIEERENQSPYEMDISLMFNKSSNEGLCITAVGNGYSGYTIVANGTRHEYNSIDEIPDDIF